MEHNSRDTVVNISIEEKDEFIEINIKDNGQGIDEEELKHIFDRYYRGSNKNSSNNGSGLGMAIAKEIIEGHQGTITIQSEISQGTLIKVIFKK